ncbi:MAG: hypothetical protein WCS03_08060 [Bacteroidota bacterium]
MPGGKNNINGRDGKLFVKGDARLNRLGRPKKMNLEGLLRKVLMGRVNNQAALKGILIKLRDQALAGDIRAAELLLDRAFGKAKQVIDSSTPFQITGITYIQQNNGNYNKADPEATRSMGSIEDTH